MEDKERDLQMARQIAAKVSSVGGKSYYVGGYVRDKLLGKENKDIDIEIHGISPDMLFWMLSGFGSVQSQGASFGVYNVKGYDIDIAQPRKEHATGRGHKDFEVSVDPNIGVKKAAMRRDFTMNAIMQDVLTGEMIDPFNGQADIKAGLIRHVNDESFKEDSLRVFRAAQFASRFGFKVSDETMDIMRDMDVSALSRERVYGEMQKALLKADRPSVFFDTLRDCGKLDEWFPEVKALIGCKQTEKYHPEGDVYNHTMMVVDAAARMKNRTTNPEFFMVSALCHDFGKPKTSKVEKDGLIHSYHHEIEGVPVAEAFLDRLNPDKKLKSYVTDMVANHMELHQMFTNKSRIKTTNHFFDRVRVPKDICYLYLADNCGKGQDKEAIAERKSFVFDRVSTYEKRREVPMVSGKDLIALGLKPSTEFSTLLETARKAHFSGVDRMSVLKGIATEHHIQMDDSMEF